MSDSHLKFAQNQVIQRTRQKGLRYFDNTSHTTQAGIDINGNNIQYLQYSKEEYERLLEISKTYTVFDVV